MDRSQILAEIQQKMGFVPDFFKNMSDPALEIEWTIDKQMETQQGVIPKKSQALIGVAVAGAIPCPYSVIYTTESAKAAGATDAEIEAACYLAKNLVGWTTFLNGVRADWETFKQDVQQMARTVGPMISSGKKVELGSIDQKLSREQINADIQKTLGVVPTVWKGLSDAALRIDWQGLKGYLFGPGPIPVKYRLLTGVAVGAVREDYYVVLCNTEFAKAAGVTQAELDEAVQNARMCTSWSAYLHGMQADIEQFRDDIQRMCESMKKPAKAAQQPVQTRR